MPERQLDLFADGGLPPAEPARDGSRPATATPHPRDLDDCALISAGRGGDDRLWLYCNGSDTFVSRAEVTDVWEVAGAR